MLEKQTENLYENKIKQVELENKSENLEEQLTEEILKNPKLVKLLVEKLWLEKKLWKEENPLEKLTWKLKDKVDKYKDKIENNFWENNLENYKKNISEKIFKIVKENFLDILNLLADNENINIKNLKEKKNLVIENFVDFKKQVKELLKIILMQKNVGVKDNWIWILVFDIYGNKTNKWSLIIKSDWNYEIIEKTQTV